MKLGSSFHLPAEPGTVLEKFLDAPTMQACIPGCTQLERPGASHFRGRLTNEIAHVRFDAVFSAEITELTPNRVRAVLTGEDSRLGSSLKVTAALDVVPAGAGSDVTYALELAMWGRLGRLGEAVFRRRAGEVEKQFLQAFARACAGEEVAAASSARTTAAARSQVPVAVPAPPGVLGGPVPLVAGAFAPAVSALPGVPVPEHPAGDARPPATAPVAPAAAAAAAVASLRPIADGTGPRRGGTTGRPFAAVAFLAAAFVALRKVRLARRAGR